MLDPGVTILVDLLPATATVFDLVYVPPETPLLQAARARGLRAANGSEMLIAQAAIAFERWTGVARHGRRHAHRGRASPGRRHGARLTMRLATIVRDGRPSVAVVRDGRCLPVATGDARLDSSVRAIAGSGPDGLSSLRAWVANQPDRRYRSLDDVEIGPAVSDPGSIYTVGLNYRAPGEPDVGGPARPLIYGKAAASVAGPGAILTWDRALTANVDPECELGVVIGAAAAGVPAEDAMEHVFGYTCINDISSRDAWLDGDQWLLGKSMPGFCPVGPWVVTRRRDRPGGSWARLPDQRDRDPGRPDVATCEPRSPS